MGNRGTTPDWDEEEIAKWGLFAHLSFTTRIQRAEFRRQQEEQVAKYLKTVMAVLPEDSEENRLRVAKAIPHVITCRTMGDTGFIDWKDRCAIALYENWCERSGKKLALRYDFIPFEERIGFLTIIYAILFVLENEPKTA